MILDKSLDKQLEARAQKYMLSIGKTKDEFEANKNECIKEYLFTHPKIQAQYKEKKQHLLKIQRGIAVGGIVLSGVVGVAYTLSNSNINPIQPIKIEAEAKTINNNENKAKDFKLEQLEALKIKRTENNVNKNRKEIIVQQYNKEHPEKPITVEQLGIIESTHYLLANLDKLGNIVSLERTTINDASKILDSQTILNNSLHYIYQIDGKTVAIYTPDGVNIKSDEITNQDSFFQSTVPLVNKSIQLKKIYKYRSSEDEKMQAENEYVEQIASFVQTTNLVKSQDIERTN